MQTIAALISVLAAAIAFGQVHLMRNSAHGSLLNEMLRWQGAQDLRDDRARMYGLASKPFESWSAEEYRCVERVATVLDQIGFLVKHRYVTIRAFLTWHSQVVLCFQIADPLISYRRSSENVPELFLNFEWLARRSLKATRQRAWWHQRSWQRLQAQTPTLTTTFDLTEVSSTRRTDNRTAVFNGPSVE
ncbi:hypothetical protein Amsp01_043980 [Amycolatopsis sp. NBRC 101858]|uniref:DUF4760 domain-containing protein n=1 Tax=Amycolatopsis sp. NBRC 101858 TaxID=3032200 RepID=UPI00249FF475|nr:hypothetical protein [Amycolatopsis sp. NBRC 101858]GLY38374.1 hypothetical protein Amsp01_043980 [Amycolatopsis sp. NBRC 101858]